VNRGVRRRVLQQRGVFGYRYVCECLTATASRMVKSYSCWSDRLRGCKRGALYVHVYLRAVHMGTMELVGMHMCRSVHMCGAVVVAGTCWLVHC